MSMTSEELFHILGVTVVASPALLVAALGLSMLIGSRLSESVQTRLMKTAVGVGLSAAVSILCLMLFTGLRYVPVEFGHWVSLPAEAFHFHLKFVFDRLSVPFVILSFMLCGIVGAFSSVYMHRERGYRRFFLLYALFLLGMVVSSLAGTIETLFFGWELVGLSSALLVAYFHERPGPVRNGLRIWTVYRIADAAFLIAALSMHHLSGAGDLNRLMGTGPWPDGAAAIEPGQALAIGSLLLLAAAGKSGMIPFSGWLPRAMEGPTPSSAIFYGALSVHLGTYLLLRLSPLMEVSVSLRCCTLALGMSSAIFGTLVSRVQSDIKNALAYASLAQVGLITVEIGLGLHYIPLIHMIGHVCLRTLQFLRAPSLLRDHQMLENAVGQHLTSDEVSALRPTGRAGLSLYRWAFHRGYLDSLLDAAVRPFTQAFHRFDGLERWWIGLLAGEKSHPTDRLPPGTSLEELS